jgi:S1-C subfamily serine protease
VKIVGPSVTRIDCEKEIPPMLAMFNDNYKEGDLIKISGTGVVVSSDGFVLTNAHVVDGSKKIVVTLANGRAYKATLISSDELTDLAVLRADVGTDSLQKAPIGDSSILVSGDWVIAVGCPVGLDFTVTLGVVSNPKRSAAEVGAPHMRGSFIQTDAALNSGNSGGPLVNENGQVVGINTMVRTNTEAIGFSIPINKAREVYEILKQVRL